MRLGEVVRNKKSGELGTVEFSSFGFSVHVWNEDPPLLSKILGDKVENVSKYWEVVDMPEGYEVCEYGGIRKIKESV